MSDLAKDRFEALKAYFDKLPANEQERHAVKGQEHENAVFDMIKEGDGVGLYASVQKDAKLLERQDVNGMIPLHWSSADRSGLAYEIFTSQPNKAPWVRDKFDRLPLDVAKETGREQISDKMERVTYPQLFRHEKDGLENPEKINAFYEKHKEHGKTNTMPPNEKDQTKQETPERTHGRER